MRAELDSAQGEMTDAEAAFAELRGSFLEVSALVSVGYFLVHCGSYTYAPLLLSTLNACVKLPALSQCR